MTQNNNQFNSFHLITFIYNKRFPILLVCLISIVLSIIVSFSLTEKYKSTAVIFPARQSSVSISKDLLTDITRTYKNVMEFGEDEELDRFMQILQSEQIRGNIVKKYDLINHYKIDIMDTKAQEKVRQEYDSNIEIKRTEFLSIKISVLDGDPEVAAKISNDIADMADKVVNEMFHQRGKKALEIVQAEYKGLQDEINEIEMDLGDLIANPNNSKEIDIIKKDNLKEILTKKNEQLVFLKTKLKEAELDATQELPQKYILDAAYPSKQKAYPIRWLIVLVSTIFAFFIAVVILAIMDRIRAEKQLQRTIWSKK